MFIDNSRQKGETDMTKMKKTRKPGKYIGFLDLEYNTGFDTDNAPGLLSIGIVIADSCTLEKKDSFYSLTRPRINVILTEYCQVLTKLSQEDIYHAPPLDHVLAQVIGFLRKWSVQTLYVYGNCDKPVLAANIASIGMEKKWHYLCDMILDISVQITRTLFDEKQSLALEKLAALLGTTPRGHWHNALTDADMLYHVYCSLKRKSYSRKDVASANAEMKLRQIYNDSRNFYRLSFSLPEKKKKELLMAADLLWTSQNHGNPEEKVRIAALCDDLTVICGDPPSYKDRLFRFI